MRISLTTLQVLIDYGDCSAYRAFMYAILDNMKDCTVWAFDDGLFYLLTPNRKWYSCIEQGLRSS